MNRVQRFRSVTLLIVGCILAVTLLAICASAQPAPAATSTSAALAASPPSTPFNVKAAVDAYLNSVPPAARARSDAYYEGGYWLQLWDFLLAALISILLMNTGLSARMRNFAERFTHFKALHTFLYWIHFLLITTLLQLPLGLYEGFFRERKYGLMNQTFASWIGDQLIGLLLSAILGGLLIVALFALVRRAQRTWWVWGAAVSTLFLMFTILISPVYIDPLFNNYTLLQDPKITEPILSMARANGIPATNVWEVNASKQSNRVSANVSGFLGTERITLNDNLLRRCTLAEIATTMGHEMGHYVMHHVYKALVFFGLETLVFFAFLRWSLSWSLTRWGERWKIRGIGDTAVLPLVLLLGSMFLFAMTPVNNSYIRVQEYEADIFGLNAAREPDAEAQVDMLLGEYRKLDPSPLEEIIFYDHPSGRTRITAAMRWKAEHLNDIPPYSGKRNQDPQAAGGTTQPR